ncbi:hypothetical protein O59_003864 [Cellvibrio sp. BR]|nr:hypothetical protein O59_003864 [Cellvibrio sp. BR]
MLINYSFLVFIVALGIVALHPLYDSNTHSIKTPASFEAGVI